MTAPASRTYELTIRTTNPDLKDRVAAAFDLAGLDLDNTGAPHPLSAYLTAADSDVLWGTEYEPNDGVSGQGRDSYSALLDHTPTLPAAAGVGTLADAERRSAAKALRMEAMRGLEAVEQAKAKDGPFRDFAVRLMQGLADELARRADAIESGEVPL